MMVVVHLAPNGLQKPYLQSVPSVGEMACQSQQKPAQEPWDKPFLWVSKASLASYSESSLTHSIIMGTFPRIDAYVRVS